MNRNITSSIYSSGTISNISNPDNVFRFAYSIDSINNFHIKIYSFSGFKLFDGIITKDSLITKFIADDSYAAGISSVFNKYKNTICLNKVLIDLVIGFKNQSSFCYNAVPDSSYSSDRFNIFTRDYSKVCSIEYLNYIESRKKESLPKTMLVYFENGNTFRVEFKY